MSLVIQHVFLPHTDPDASLAFYRDLLGFIVRRDVGYGHLRWIALGPVDEPNTSIVLHPPADDPTITEDERRTILELMAKGNYGRLTLASDDVDATFARLETRAEVVQEPMDQAHGRDCAFRDPAGNLIRVSQRDPEPAAPGTERTSG